MSVDILVLVVLVVLIVVAGVTFLWWTERL